MQAETRKIDSVRRRYLITLASNLVFFFARLVTAGIVPRALGPKQLGDFSFLSRVSGSFRNLFNLETSSAFFNYNSKHEHTGPAVKAYSVWLLGQLILSISLVVLAVVVGLKELIWPGQQFKYIIWVITFDWVFFSASILRQLSDSKGYTTRAQLINLALSLTNIALLVIFALTGILNLGKYIAIQTFCSACISLCIIIFVIAPHKDIYWLGSAKKHLREIAKYFYKFCHPLVVVVLVGFAFTYLDRLFLQRFFGSVEQGYFHIASSWAAFATVFTASILSIYKREMAHSLGKDNSIHAAGIFSRYLKMMYFLTLVLAMFLAFHAETLLTMIAGPGFKKAASVVMIMAFYPILQVYGQLGGAAFYASERTGLLRNISIVSKLLGIPLSYFLLAPSTMLIPGLGLGAVGLAVKSVIWSLVVTQVYLIYNCRFFKISPRPFWWHQLYCVVTLALVMFLSKTIIGYFLNGPQLNIQIIRLVLEIILYFTSVGVIVYMFPKIAGTNRQEIFSLIERIRKGRKHE